MKIAICDDEQKDIDLLKGHIEKHRETHEITEFLSPTPFFAQSESGECFDLLFLDIQMPDGDGWEIAKYLKRVKSNIYVAIVTVLGDRVFESFDRVNWFAKKPIGFETVNKILDNAQEVLFPETIRILDGSRFIELIPSEIINVEASHNYCLIYTTHRDEPIKVRNSLNAIKNQLNSPCFFQPHRCDIINLDYYATIKDNDIHMKNGAKIYLSKDRKTEFTKALMQYLKTGVKFSE